MHGFEVDDFLTACYQQQLKKARGEQYPGQNIQENTDPAPKPSPRQRQLFIIKSDSNTFTFNYKEGDTVGSMKGTFQTMGRVAPWAVRLLFNEQQIEDNMRMRKLHRKILRTALW